VSSLHPRGGGGQRFVLLLAICCAAPLQVLVCLDLLPSGCFFCLARANRHKQQRLYPDCCAVYH
jgi:hypothetical protein